MCLDGAEHIYSTASKKEQAERMSEEWFGEKLKAYRREHYLTQEELGRQMHISTSHISALERGLKCPRLSTVQAFNRLQEAKEWDRFDIISELTDEEFVSYMNLWQRLRRLDPQREREAMIAFMNLLALIRKNIFQKSFL